MRFSNDGVTGKTVDVPKPAKCCPEDLARQFLLLSKVEHVDISRSRRDSIPYGRLIQYSAEPSLLLRINVSLLGCRKHHGMHCVDVCRLDNCNDHDDLSIPTDPSRPPQRGKSCELLDPSAGTNLEGRVR